MGWTEEELAQVLQRRQKTHQKHPPSARIAPSATIASPKVSKHRNRKTAYKGILFDSAKEAARYQTLELWQQVGALRDLRRQVDFDLWACNGERIARYRADFTYWSVELGRQVIEDTKSPHSRTLRDYRLKFKLMRAQGTPIEEV